jgi:N-methylhydantoinase A
MYTIDIDTGGTFTDGFFTREGDSKTAKVLTTPHDLTVCMANCIREGAKQFGIGEIDLLSNTDVIRYSTTVGVNTLITKTGSKVGLIVTKGYGDSLYAKAPGESEPIYSIVPKDLIMEVEEEINDEGTMIKPLNPGEVLVNMQHLIDMGVRAVTVSLKNSNVNSSHERQIKAIIKEQYPSYFLGSVRVFLGSEMSDLPGDFYRTNAVVMNGYIHDTLVKYLYKAEDDLRSKLCPHPLMIAHSHGGVARVAKTRAIDTYSSGPALGVIGAGEIGKTYGIQNVLTVDIGGTSLDLGLIYHGTYNYSSHPVIAGLPVNVPMITTHSVALASGSIARLDKNGTLCIGPKSVGARPGPACFDLGGLEPTVTDADVVLGYIDPGYFLGGRIKLNKAKAFSAIKAKIADPQGITVEEAAYRIREETGTRTQKEIVKFIEGQGISVEELADFAVVVFGGAGPTHYCDFARNLRFRRSLVSPYSSVFSAFGSSTIDLAHNYSKFIGMKFCDGETYLTDYDKFNEIVRMLLETGERDIRGEGFSGDNAVYTLELIGDLDLSGIRIKTDKLFLHSEDDVKTLCAKFLEN